VGREILQEEALVEYEGDQRNETGVVLAPVVRIAGSGRQNANVSGVGVVGRTTGIVHPVVAPICTGRTLLAEEPEASGCRLVELADVNPVRLVEEITEVARRWIEAGKAWR